ncbi:MAG TPA: ABC transporter permease subunit [Solirubrobacteraceae bacterium]|jgi:phosphate transport system permease protein|nr:ABC transporter permease subunit [Solirubrobacteraceae bacterium]
MAAAEPLAPTPLAPPPGLTAVKPAGQRTSSWPLIDRVGYWLCWATGIALCAIALAIVLFMFVKGISYLKPSLFVESPAPAVHQDEAGGFLDPILGTFILTALGIAIAAPLGIAIAAWLSEYARPRALARAVESAIEMIGGVPSVVLAIFGLLLFSQGFLGFLSQRAANGAVYGRSFFAAGAIMAVLALPLIVGSVREGLAQVPDRMREAAYALGKTRASCIRHVLLPAIRGNIASGIVLGMGRIIGDTAIVTILIGVTLQNEGVGHVPIVGALRGTGSTLTSYVYTNSPAGEGGAPQKAYAAAFVLLMIVLLLNALVTRLTGDSRRLKGPALAARLRMIGRSMPWIP